MLLRVRPSARPRMGGSVSRAYKICSALMDSFPFSGVSSAIYSFLGYLGLFPILGDYDSSVFGGFGG